MSDSRFNMMKDGSFSVSVAGTRRQLTSANVPCRRLLLQAQNSNASAIVIGGDSVVATSATIRGLSLDPGVTLMFNIENLNRVWVDGRNAGDKITYLYWD